MSNSYQTLWKLWKSNSPDFLLHSFWFQIFHLKLCERWMDHHYNHLCLHQHVFQLTPAKQQEARSAMMRPLKALATSVIHASPPKLQHLYRHLQQSMPNQCSIDVLGQSHTRHIQIRSNMLLLQSKHIFQSPALAVSTQVSLRMARW